MLCPNKKGKTEKLKVETKIQNLIFAYSLTFKFELSSYCLPLWAFHVINNFIIGQSYLDFLDMFYAYQRKRNH